MTALPFVRVAADPTLIPGIYDSCDQWCMYCPATQWCLAYRCTPEVSAGEADDHRSLTERLYEGMLFLKHVSAAEGRPTPEVDALLSNDQRKLSQLLVIDDPLHRLGRRYGQISDAYLLSRADFPFEMKARPTGPTPFEVFAWYHQLVPGKVYRAVVSASQAARGDPGRHDDALISAKVALIGIDRSLEALAAMAVEDADPRLPALQAQLRRLRHELEARFPSAGGFVRPGLDASP
jgi:hypothetical protein